MSTEATRLSADRWKIRDLSNADRWAGRQENGGGPLMQRASRRSYRIAHLIQVAKGVEEVLGTISAGLSLAYLADQAHVAYKARQVIAREQEEDVEEAEIVSEMESLVQKIDIEAAMKKARNASITFKIPDEPEQQDNR